MFLQRVVEHENKQGNTPLPIDSLIVLAALCEHKRLGADELAQHIQRDATQAKKAKKALEHLVEVGLVEAHGRNRSRSYTLSAEMYQAKGDKLAYTRQVGFSIIQHPEMVRFSK